MLDESENTQPHSDASTAEVAPAPRRRRRAASRPAGPPVEVSTPVTPTAESAAAQPVGDATPDSDTAAPAVAVPAVELPDKPVKKVARKRAVRKTAAPDPLPEVDTAEAPAPVTAAESVPEEAQRAPRKRASRKKAVAAPEPAGATPIGDVPSSDAPAQADAESAPVTPRTRRRPRKELANPFAEPQAIVASHEVAATDDDLATPAGAVEVSAKDHAADGLTAAADDADDAQPDDAQPGEGQPGEGQPGEDQSEDSDSEDDAEDSDDRPRRRRRRRGGRRRRRGGQDDDSAEQGGDTESGEDSSESGASESSDDSDDDDSDDQAEGDSEGGRRRRRRRRRRGESSTSDDDDNVEVVDRVRDPRRGKASDEVTGIDGSTRMEAKRQRRREGRAAGRRRAPILSEAEFLARRESVKRTMVIRQNEELSQIAVLEDNVLVEHYVDRASATSLIGNVYLGRVQNVLPSMEAAFIDIGRGRNAVLYAGEVDWDAFGSDGQTKKVEKVLKSGMPILVQVTKDPVGAKGARLTNHISLPGRYIVYSPGGHLSGISRKLSDTERKRLKDILGELVAEDASVIVRTAAEGASEDELVRDVNRLKAQWEAIEKKVKGGQAPQQLYAEPDPTVRIVRDLFTEDFAKLVIDGNGTSEDAYDTVTAYVSHVAPHLAERIERWDGAPGEIFAEHRIDEQIAKALERKVFLPSGGSLVIDRTEAMTVIDVNTGKFTGSGGNLEATVTSNNLEAAEEVVRQLRLRDIGGIIVIDFIDMVLPANRELLIRRLVECLGRDRTRHQVAEVTSLGLVQMTRKKIGTGLAEAFTEDCEHCKGRGFEIHDMPVDTQSPADGGDRGRGRGRSRGGKGRGNNSDGSGNNGSGNNGDTGRKGGNDQQPEPVKRKFPHPKPRSEEVKSAEDAEARDTEADQAPVTDQPLEQAAVTDQPVEQAPATDEPVAQAPADVVEVLPDLTPPVAAEAPSDAVIEQPVKAPARRARGGGRRRKADEAPADGEGATS